MQKSTQFCVKIYRPFTKPAKKAKYGLKRLFSIEKRSESEIDTFETQKKDLLEIKK